MSETTKKIVLIADDAKINRDILSHALSDEYDIIEAENGEETIKCIAKYHRNIAVVLLDINMPRINGFQVLDVLNKKNAMKYLPIILITSEYSEENMRKGYEYGAVAFIAKPFDIMSVKNRIRSIVKIYGEKNRLEVVTVQQNKQLLEKSERLDKLNNNVMDMLGSIIEFRCSEKTEHIKHVKEFTRIMCQSLSDTFPEYKMTSEQIKLITAASSLHDIGKIMINDNILNKSSKLTSEEYEIIKSHTLKGCEILNAISEYQDKKYFECCYEICRNHHERYDGKGYPDGLKYNEIPVPARIVSIVDAFDVLMVDSTHKQAVDFEKAFEMVLEGECGVFAPELLHCFKLNKDKFWEIYNKI